MSPSINVEGSAPVSFAERLAASEAFKSMFHEGMNLVEEAAAYLAKLQQRASFPKPAAAPRAASKIASPAPSKSPAPAKTVASARPAKPVEPAAPVPPPAKVEPPAHALTDQVQADAYYNRGLGAYYRGDLSKAAAEWKKAVKPLRDSWAAAVTKTGGDAAAIDADLQATLKKYEAGI